MLWLAGAHAKVSRYYCDTIDRRLRHKISSLVSSHPVDILEFIF